MAVPAFWIVNGSAPETMSVATWVWAGRSPETNVVPPVTRPLASTVTFGYVPATTPVAANEATPAATASPPTGSIWTMPLLVVVASGYENAPNVWPAAKSMMASIATWLLAFRAIPRSPELSALRHLTAPRLGRRTRPVAALFPDPNSAPSWNVFRPVMVTAPFFRT